MLPPGIARIGRGRRTPQLRSARHYPLRARHGVGHNDLDHTEYTQSWDVIKLSIKNVLVKTRNSLPLVHTEFTIVLCICLRSTMLSEVQ